MKKITIDDDCRHLSQSHITVGYIGENKTEQIEFKIPEKYKNYGKKICFEANGKTFQKLFDNVTDNTVTFTRDMTKYDELYATVVFFKTNDDDEIVAKTSLLHILIEGAVNCPDDVSPDDPKVIILDKLINDVTNLNNEITLSEKERTNNESQRIENENHRIANETQREEYMENLKSSVENGDFNGKDATINGFNTLNIVAGTNIDLKQENDTLEINNTYQYDDSDLVKKIDNINGNFKNYSLITETGNKLDLTIDSKTYIMTLKLKDKDDNVLSTGSVDLPIESMIINVTYDNDNEKLTFTLQNGSVIDVPLDSLISGLVNETDLKNILKDYAKTTDVPTKVSELENDSNHVKNNDYAAENNAGVIKTDIPFYATAVTSNGILYATPRTLEQYAKLNDTGIISKGTLENVIAGKNLETANNKVNFVNENSTDTQYPSAKCTYEIKNNLDRLKDNVLEVGEVSNTYIHAEDSSLNELKELSVDGVCEQQTTTGSQEFNFDSYKKALINAYGNVVSGTYNSFTIIRLYSDNMSAQLNLKENTKYYIKFNWSCSKGNQAISIEYSDGTIRTLTSDYSSSAKNGIVNFTTDETKTLTKLNFTIFSTDTNYIINNMIITTNSTATIEPYTGGQPSPSPDYPQEIKTITDSLNITSCNKNLLDKTLIQRGKATGYGDNGKVPNESTSNSRATLGLKNVIKIEPNKEYTLTIIDGFRFAIGQLESNLKTLGDTGWLTSNTYTIKTKSNAKYVGFNFSKTDNSDFTDKDWNNFINGNIQFELGESTPYEQHLETQITANLPDGEFIGKIDDTYKDTLNVVYKEDGHCHLILNKMIGKVMLDGSENWRLSNYTNDIIYSAYAAISNYFNGLLISDLFSYQNNVNATTTTEYVATGGDSIRIGVLKSRLNASTINDFKSWLSTHNTEVYYVLSTPYEVDLGIVDMPLSYDEITNIFTDSDLLPKINAKYYKDFKLSIENYINNYIDNKLNKLQPTTNDVPAADNTQSDENQNSDLS